MEEAEGEKIIIAFIDSACSAESYKRLSERLWENINEIPNNGCDDDENGYVDDIHGWNFYEGNGTVFSKIRFSHCDLVLRSFADDLKENTSRVNYEIMLLNILGEEGECSIDNLIRAIEYAQKNGAKVCNLSLSTYKDSPDLKKVIEMSDMLFIAAAGNEGENLDEGFPSFPSNYNLENVISVAATDEDGELLNISNYGENTIDIKMNGIMEFENGIVEGTSIAAAKVTAFIVGNVE